MIILVWFVAILTTIISSGYFQIPKMIKTLQPTERYIKQLSNSSEIYALLHRAANSSTSCKKSVTLPKAPECLNKVVKPHQLRCTVLYHTLSYRIHQHLQCNQQTKFASMETNYDASAYYDAAAYSYSLLQTFNRF
jgi:hypothetical protein